MDIEKLKAKPPEKPKPYKRRRWVSVLLTFLGFGLPLIYCGNLRAGILMEIVWILFNAGFVVLWALFPSIVTVALLILFLILFLIAFLVFIIGHTKRVNEKDITRIRNLWLVIVLVFGVFWAVNEVGDFLANKYLVEAYRIPSSSMEPTLTIGDYLMATKGTDPKELSYGDLIVYRFPPDPGYLYIHRLIAKGGDRVRIENKRVFLNGRQLRERYVQYADFARYIPYSNFGPWGAHVRDNMPEITVPVGKFFVLGDNRDNSADSRYWGFLDEELVIGKARFIHFSWDSENSSVRWDRIGNRLDQFSSISSE